MTFLAGIAVAIHQSLATANDEAQGFVFSTEQLKRKRRQMIAKVRHDWIEGVLYRSLYKVAKINIGLEDRPDVVDNPLTRLVEQAAKSPQELPHCTQIKAVFDAHIGCLLILGAPGSGKTTMLLELARDLLDLADKDETHAIPVYFNLSSWATHRYSLEKWLVDELRGPLYGETKLAEHWITTEQILPLLDGLDEVEAIHRDACAEAINTFRNEHGLLQMVVCSRLNEYHSLGGRLRFPSAVVVQPLKRLEVEKYLDRNEPLKRVRTATERDPILWELLDNPLMIRIAIDTYEEVEEIQPLAGESKERRRRQLFANYATAMFSRRHIKKEYSPSQTTHWLSSLAGMLIKANQRIFYLESLDFQSLPTRPERWLARLGLVVFSGLVGLSIGSLVGAKTGWMRGRMIDGLAIGLIAGLIGNVLNLRPVEEVRFHWTDTSSKLRDVLRDCISVFRFAGLIGLSSGLVIALYVGLDVLFGGYRPGGVAGGLSERLGGGLNADLASAFVVGVLFGVYVGLYIGFFSGLFVALTRLFTSEAAPATRSAINGGTFRSVTFAITAWLIFMLMGGLIGVQSVQGLMGVGLIGGLIGGLLCGGLFALKHFVLRLLLWTRGSAPLRYVLFLAEAKDLLFLRQVGTGYQFIHPLLLEYFGSLEEPVRISVEVLE